MPRKPDKSRVWEYMGVPKYQMPKKSAPQPSVEERQIIYKWILDGAEFPKEIVRTPIDDRSALTAVRDHLKSLPAADRPYQRYLSLNDLHNNKTIDEEILRIHKAAASKLVNSLSWQPEIVVPEAIKGTEDTILNIDLRKLGWSADDWRAIAKFYPYGVTHPEDESFRDLESEIAGLTRFRLSVLRADWFVVTVSRPPLYDQLLRLPLNLRDLELKLNVRLEENFDRDVLRRGGLITSGVSRHNRLVERHPTPFGAYWRSYDFGSSGGDGNLLLKPLGPKFPGNPFADQAFVQAGGEVVFHLPNGLQGYMLAKADDSRLDGPAPIAIVRDRDETSGTPEVVNGLSCIYCHKNGMKFFQDEIRQHPAVFADARIKMQRLYPAAEDMNALLQKDEKRFLDALSRRRPLSSGWRQCTEGGSRPDRAGRRSGAAVQPGPLARVGRRRAGPARRRKDPVQAWRGEIPGTRTRPVARRQGGEARALGRAGRVTLSSRGQRAGPGTEPGPMMNQLSTWERRPV